MTGDHVSLRDYIDQRMTDANLRHEQRFQAQEKVTDRLAVLLGLLMAGAGLYFKTVGH